MKNNLFSAPAVACLLTALTLGVLTIGPFMHETDQAWLLDGGRAIASGHPEIAMGEFNYDKQFVSYWIAAALALFFPRPTPVDAFVTAGNVLNMVLFWGALAWLLARSARRLPLALALPVILAPAFLVHSPFYASAFTSAALVLALARFLDRRCWSRPLRLGVFLLAFLAVGARADAMFLLPLLAMLHSPQRTFGSVLKSPNTWLLAGGGLAAFFLGRAMYLKDSVDWAGHAFHLKAYLGFVAFGLGGAALVLLAGLHAVWSARRLGRCRLWTFFTGLGLAMPMGYYSFQMLTPRHCMVGVLSVALFICARRGRALFAVYFRPRPLTAVVKFVLLLASAGPLLIGLNLSELRHPRLTVSEPTLLPSGAGACPTGAYLAHAWHVRRDQGFIDHNHAVWMAAKNTRFEPTADKRVDIIGTPVESYLIFAIRLQGLEPLHHALLPGKLPSRFYVDSRSLLRFQYIWPSSLVPLESFFATTTLEPATTTGWRGITLLRGDTNRVPETGSLPARLWVLNECFGGDEFRIESAASVGVVPAGWDGRKLVLASEQPFIVTVDGAVREGTRVATTLGAWHVCEFNPVRAGQKILVRGATPEEIMAAVSAFPAWMSLRKL